MSTTTIQKPTAAANQPVFNERGLLDANIPPEAEIQHSMMRADGQSFAQWMESRVARVSDPPLRLGRAEVPGRLRPEVPPRADALRRHRRHRRGQGQQHRAGRRTSPSRPW